MSGAPSLEELLVATGEGDRAAFRALYERTSAKLYGIILRILPDRQQAEDAMQDGYVRIWRNAAGYDAARGRPITWLAAIARNAAIDARRVQAARGGDRHAPLEPELLIARPEGASAELLAALAACLGRLEEGLRDLILAAYVHGDSREELAGRLGKPTGTIKTWLHRGLASLKTCLDG
ncbi:sigma-70 family RNA polymerase sigma factor [Flavisphingomonas formosensis]|uniref:sigma-70 family RNA polymerase sigma factor n=1 Tax=Flavisphingomonas formosensis TaxID=861534 RepID=UPI0012F8BB35|nr:sigma-70 family RNA polymerase sigma factor [Sphingomonas formosensis]